MKRHSRAWCWILAVSVAIIFALKEATALAQSGVGRLTIQLANVTEEAIVDYEKVEVPVIAAEGGVFTVPIICYSGPAVVLGVEDCATNSLLVESSRDLTNWAAFPQPGFQLTLSTNSAAVIPITGPKRFFRGVSD